MPAQSGGRDEEDPSGLIQTGREAEPWPKFDG